MTKNNIYDLANISITNPKYSNIDFIEINRFRLDLFKNNYDLREIIYETRKKYLNDNTKPIKLRTIPYIFYHYLYIIAKLLQTNFQYKEVLDKFETITNFKKMIKIRNELIKDGQDFITIEKKLGEKFNYEVDEKEISFFNNQFNLIKNYNKFKKRGRKLISKSKKEESKLKNKLIMREKMRQSYTFIKKIKENLLSEDEFNIIKNLLNGESIQCKEVIKIELLEKLKNFKF